MRHRAKILSSALSWAWLAWKRKMLRVSIFSLALLVLLSFEVPADPGPGVGIDGRRLHLRIRRAAVERMSFVSNDANIPFPAIEGPNDPRTAELEVEIFTAAGQTSSFRIREGDYEGIVWKVVDRKVDMYKYKNRLSPAGHSWVKKFLLKEGRIFKLAARRHGINLREPPGEVILRLTMGDVRVCTHFINPIFNGVVPGRDEDSTSFFSRTGVAPADCTDETIETVLGAEF